MDGLRGTGIRRSPVLVVEGFLSAHKKMYIGKR